ncbi:hypothetical protein VaNZ11_011954 [Volvox africanus]|uniref:Uncharacterized protein n=1 Tax=Volvox africanus TaxID=51714 RepID=A0ABQ5SCQ9_9CHLO|nr:hypothetical protein VaNZ11_011954 [Volvox africanus]
MGTTNLYINPLASHSRPERPVGLGIGQIGGFQALAVEISQQAVPKLVEQQAAMILQLQQVHVLTNHVRLVKSLETRWRTMSPINEHNGARPPAAWGTSATNSGELALQAGLLTAAASAAVG